MRLGFKKQMRRSRTKPPDNCQLTPETKESHMKALLDLFRQVTQKEEFDAINKSVKSDRKHTEHQRGSVVDIKANGQGGSIVRRMISDI